MLRFAVVLYVAALASADTITISTSSDASVCTKSDCSQLTDNEIALIRDTWAIAKAEKDVPTRIIVEHLKAHPKIIDLLPSIAGVPLADLPTNDVFVNRIRPRTLHAMNFLVNNLDSPSILRAGMSMINSQYKMYVDYVSVEQQIKETNRIIVKILEEELGGRLSAEAKAAWLKGLDFGFGFMTQEPISATSSSLSASDIASVRQTFAAIKDNVNIPIKALLKMFELHPAVQQLYPSLANVAFDQLANNKEFLTQASIAGSVLNLCILNIDNDQFITELLHKHTQPYQFVSYIDLGYQNDEIVALFLDAVESEVTLSTEAKAALTRVLLHLSAVSTSAISQTDRVGENIFTPNERALIRDTWALAKRMSEIAPKIFLRKIAVDPDFQKLFPRLASVPAADLTKKKDFFNHVYTYQTSLTFLVDNIDNADLITSQLNKVATAAFFTTKGSIAQQMDETTGIFLDVLKSEMGDAFTNDAAAAFTKLFNYVRDTFVAKIESGSLSAADKTIIKDNFKMIQKNPDFGKTLLLKMFRAHPSSKDHIFPELASTPISALEANPLFQDYGKIMMAGLKFLFENAGDKQLLKQMLSNKPVQSYFVPNASIVVQMEDTARYVMEAMDETLGSRFSPTTRDVFKRALGLFTETFVEILGAY